MPRLNVSKKFGQSNASAVSFKQNPMIKEKNVVQRVGYSLKKLLRFRKVGPASRQLSMLFNENDLAKTLKKELYGDQKIEFGDASWQLSVAKVNRSLVVRIDCERKAANVSCNGNLSVTIGHKNASSRMVMDDCFSFTGNKLRNQWKCDTLMDYNAFFEYSNGFVDAQGNVLVRAKVQAECSTNGHISNDDDDQTESNQDLYSDEPLIPLDSFYDDRSEEGDKYSISAVKKQLRHVTFDLNSLHMEKNAPLEELIDRLDRIEQSLQRISSSEPVEQAVPNFARSHPIRKLSTNFASGSSVKKTAALFERKFSAKQYTVL